MSREAGAERESSSGSRLPALNSGSLDHDLSQSEEPDPEPTVPPSTPSLRFSSEPFLQFIV